MGDKPLLTQTLKPMQCRVLARRRVSFAPPEELDDDQVALYNEEVRRKVIVLLKKAIRIYEKSLKLGKRMHSNQSWLEQLEVALSRMKSLYLEEEAALRDAL